MKKGPSWRLRLRAQRLEPRYAPARVDFVEHVPILEGDLDLPEAVYAADLDDDGDTDVISASRGDDKIAWYENLDGAGTFGPPQIITTDADAAMSVYAADLDGDLDLDVVSVSRDDHKIAWYENTDGVGTFGPQQIISTEVDGIRSVDVADLDGDGDLDVLSPSGGPNQQVVWFENTDGKGTFGPARAISTHRKQAWAVRSADVDGDRDLDVIVSWGWGDNDDTVAWLENTSGVGDFGEPQVIGFFGGVRSLFAEDADGDGDVDVLTGRGWAENIDGTGRFQPRDLYSTDYSRTASVGDLDRDGHLDVVSFPLYRNTILWSRNTGELGTFETNTLIATGKYISSIQVVDINGDGDLDILAANVILDELFWYENVDGAAAFGPRNVFTASQVRPSNLRAVDLDADGDLDVLAASSGSTEVKIAWYENTDGHGAFSPQRLIVTDVGHGNRIGAQTDLCTLDMDGDDDIDIVASLTFLDDGAVHSHISWYENTGGSSASWPQQVIAEGLGGSVRCEDLDRDGDSDILSAFNYWDDDFYYARVFWLENTDGASAFGPPISIASQTNSLLSVSTVDIDGDGDVDVLATSNERGTDGGHGNHVVWYENIGGEDMFGQPRTIAAKSDGTLSARPVDLDGDRDLDILVASNEERSGSRYASIAWFENTDGAGDFGSEWGITSSFDNMLDAYAEDFDGDADLDVLVVSYGSRQANVAWHENTDGTGTFGAGQTVATGAAYSLNTIDLDDDGDRDILFVTPTLLGYEIVWHENTDRNGTFGPRETIADGVVPVLADVDGDHDLDLLTATEDDKIIWHENVTNYDPIVLAGDANRDGQFDQRDIVQMLAAGKYQSGEPATWWEGDHNRDGLFDELDIVVALQTGSYLQRAYTGP